jgi:hypothetical protein
MDCLLKLQNHLQVYFVSVHNIFSFTQQEVYGSLSIYKISGLSQRCDALIVSVWTLVSLFLMLHISRKLKAHHSSNVFPIDSLPGKCLACPISNLVLYTTHVSITTKFYFSFLRSTQVQHIYL